MSEENKEPLTTLEEAPKEGETKTHPSEEEELEEDGENVFKMEEDLFNRLKGMGFSDNAIKKSVVAGCINEDTCMQWLQMHLDHPELNTDLDPSKTVIVKKKRVLTAEEREAKIAELQAKIKRNKELEEEQARVNEKNREKSRIEMGKAMLDAKEEREKLQRMQAYEELQREKKSDAVAKEKVMLNLAIDKLVRQGHDKTEAREMAIKERAEKKEKEEEEKKRQHEEAERFRREAKGKSEEKGENKAWNIGAFIQPGPAEESSTPPPTVAVTAAPEPDPSSLAESTPEAYNYALTQLSAKTVNAEVRKNCLDTLQLVLSNILNQPFNLKVRTLKKNTTTFINRIACVPHAVEYMMLAGFRNDIQQDESGQKTPILVMKTLLTGQVRKALNAVKTFSM